MGKKLVRAQQRAASAHSGAGGFYAITGKDLGKLLRGWGWLHDPSAQGSHHKFRWNGHQVNFPITHRDTTPRVVVERAAAVMGMSTQELLTGPVLGNPGIAKAMEASQRTKDGWVQAGDHLHTDVSFRVPWDEGDDLSYEVDLTADIDWEKEPHPLDPDAGTPATPDTYPTTCPAPVGRVNNQKLEPGTCGRTLDDGKCEIHGRPLHCPTEAEPVTDKHLAAYLEAHFLDLHVSARRIYLALQRRLVADGLLTEEDIKPPTTAARPTGTVKAGTERAVIEKPAAPAAPAAPASAPSPSKDMPVTRTPPPNTPENRAKAAETARRKREERLANAPKPGTAVTIDGVLERSKGNLTEPRRRILDVLVDCDGYVADNDGFAGTKLYEAVIAKYPGSYSSGSALNGLLKDMIEDNQIKRVMPNARRTTLISLVDPLDQEFLKRGKGVAGFEIHDGALGSEGPVQPERELKFDPPEEDLVQPETRPAVEVEAFTRPPVDPVDWSGSEWPTGAQVGDRWNGRLIDQALFDVMTAPPVDLTPHLPQRPPVIPVFDDGGSQVKVPAITATSSDDDLWDVLDLLLGDATLPFNRSTRDDFDAWVSATRKLIANAR